jgi:hypothetical protein
VCGIASRITGVRTDFEKKCALLILVNMEGSAMSLEQCGLLGLKIWMARI